MCAKTTADLLKLSTCDHMITEAACKSTINVSMFKVLLNVCLKMDQMDKINKDCSKCFDNQNIIYADKSKTYQFVSDQNHKVVWSRRNSAMVKDSKCVNSCDDCLGGSKNMTVCFSIRMGIAFR